MGKIANKIKTLYWYITSQCYYGTKLSSIGKRSFIIKPLKLTEAKSIVVGNNVTIADNSWLFGNNLLESTLRVGDGTQIGHFSHIVARSSVDIGDSVLIADKVFISDCTHNYEDINTPIIKQGLSHLGNVVIGEGSWLGENVCVLGAKIGVHCVIGANSVVTEDIPDYSIAVGAPARVVKRYDFRQRKWVLVA